MDLLYWFASIRTPVMDTVMSLITHLGEETFFMVAALFVFWCVDKRRGYYLLSVGFAGTLVSQWLLIPEIVWSSPSKGRTVTRYHSQ